MERLAEKGSEMPIFTCGTKTNLKLISVSTFGGIFQAQIKAKPNSPDLNLRIRKELPRKPRTMEGNKCQRCWFTNAA